LISLVLVKSGAFSRPCPPENHPSMRLPARRPKPLSIPLLSLCLSLFLAACDGDFLPPESDTASRGPSGPGSATLSWQPPTERVDGSPLPRLSGYRILYGQQSGRYSHTIELTNPGLTRYFIDGLSEGWWYFVMVAVDAEGLESPPSAEVSKKI